MLRRQPCSHIMGHMVQAAWLESIGVQDAAHADLADSLQAMRTRWDDFVAQLQAAGWATDLVTIRTGMVRYRTH